MVIIMIGNLLTLVEDSPLAYLIINWKTNEILDGNIFAKNLFMKNKQFPALSELFDFPTTTHTLENLHEKLLANEVAFIWDIASIKHTGETFFCDLEIRPIDVTDSLYVLILTSKIKEKALQMKEWLDHAGKPIFIMTFDGNMNVGYANPRFYDYFSISEEEFRTNHENSLFPLLSPTAQIAFAKTIEDMLNGTDEFEIDLIFTLPNQEPHFCHVMGNKINIGGNVPTLYAEIVDIQKRKCLMEKYDQEEAYFNIMQDLTNDILFKVDITNKTFYYRQPYLTELGLPIKIDNFPESLPHINLFHPDDLERQMEYSQKLMEGIGGTIEGRLNLSNGRYENFSMNAKPWRNANGEISAMLGTMHSIQQTVDLTTEISVDSLTTTLNKYAFEDAITRALSNTHHGVKHALLFIDLDDFKGVNDTYGHTFGDFLLSSVGKRLKHVIREHDLVGRVGGDEFVVFFQSVEDEEVILDRANLLLKTLSNKFVQDTHQVTINASIGIAFYPHQGSSYEELYANADKALYHSKGMGKNLATIFSESEHNNL